MLITYRRHKLACKHRGEGREYRRCQCPIWVDGSLAGQEIRKSLNERDWQKAQDTVREWEAEKEIHEDDAPVTLQSAWEQMIAYLESQHLALPTVGKYRLLRRQMTAFAEDQGLTLLSQFDFATLNRFRARNLNVSALSLNSVVSAAGRPTIPRRRSRVQRVRSWRRRCRSRTREWSASSPLAIIAASPPKLH